MDSAAQADGEKRVRQLLIDPLMRRGLMRPAGMKTDFFEAMLKELCAKLAYMSDVNLAGLEEDAAQMAGGKEKDRFPVGQKILLRAMDIQPPVDDASPLMRAVFASPLGLDALAGGWAPELLFELRRTRRWPGSYAVRGIKEKADGPVRRMQDFDEQLSRGHTLSPSESQWRSGRLSMIAKCQAIADLGQGGGA